jgi:hypothetical protein
VEIDATRWILSSLCSAVRNIYSHIKLKEIINGFPREDFKIKYGACQGDPLNCSLCVLFVEPLLREFPASTTPGVQAGPDLVKATKEFASVLLRCAFDGI